MSTLNVATKKPKYRPVTAYCIPSFFLMIGGEMTLAHLTGNVNTYRVNDTIQSLSFGTIQQLFDLAIAPLFASQYNRIYNHRLFNISDSWKATLGVFVFADFVYYWAHRFGHEFNFMWAAHSIHHSSENFNLSTAIRQAAFQGVAFSWLQYFPAAVIGIPLDLFEFHRSINLVSQFWIHTPYCGNLGFIEKIFNTPAQHIIHHSRSPGYCNKNYAGLFSIWDRLFGTFEEQHRPTKFGVLRQHYTWDPVVINFKNYYLLFKRALGQKTAKEKLKCLFASSRYTAEDLRDIRKDLAKPVRYDPVLTRKQTVYCIVVSVLITIEYFYSVSDRVTGKGYRNQLLSSLYCAISISSLAQYINKTQHGRVMESGRWLLILLFLLVGDVFGTAKLAKLFDDDISNVARFFSPNIGMVVAKLSRQKRNGMVGRILLLLVAAWSLKTIT